MYNGTHAAPRKGRNSKKPLLLLLSLVLVVALAVGGTLAWLTAQTDPVVNTFTAGTGGTGIDETVTNDQKTSVKVVNKGNIDVYVRVRLVINCLDEDGNIIAGTKPSVTITNDWQQIGEYYYYKGILSQNGKTEELLASPIALSDANGKYEVNVMAQTIQVGGGAVEDAWGMTFNGTSWGPAPSNP